MTSSAGGNAPVAQAGRVSGNEKWLSLAGLILLVTGMILTVLGTQIAPLFLPGTWLILAGLLAFSVVGVLVMLRKPALT